MYLDRIAAYDKNGPAINAIISVNPEALDRSDAEFGKTGFVGRRRSHNTCARLSACYT